MMEKISCAAIRRSDDVIMIGRNHAYIFKHSPPGTCSNNKQQGFITSETRFVDREEAGKIAFAAGQIKKPTKILFSEDITEDNPWAGEVIDKLRTEKKRLMEALSYECPEKYPDNCEICNGANAGVRGNENIIDSKVVCDYCTVPILFEEKEKRRSIK